MEEPKTYSLLKNLHEGLEFPPDAVDVSMVRGDYAYYHYLCDQVNDVGWGCGYRVLQTLCSWIDPEVAPFSLNRTMAVIRELDHGGAATHLANPWIGTFEGFLFVDHVYDIACRIDSVRSAKELNDRTEMLRKHFTESGAPIFMGGDKDCYGKCILGLCRSSNTVYFLILDPHYVGILNSREEAHSKECVKWVRIDDLLEESFYNLLMPLSHGRFNCVKPQNNY